MAQIKRLIIALKHEFQMQSQKPSYAMIKLALISIASGRESQELPLLQSDIEPQQWFPTNDLIFKFN